MKSLKKSLVRRHRHSQTAAGTRVLTQSPSLASTRPRSSTNTLPDPSRSSPSSTAQAGTRVRRASRRTARRPPSRASRSRSPRLSRARRSTPRRRLRVPVPSRASSQTCPPSSSSTSLSSLSSSPSSTSPSSTSRRNRLPTTPLLSSRAIRARRATQAARGLAQASGDSASRARGCSRLRLSSSAATMCVGPSFPLRSPGLLSEACSAERDRLCVAERLHLHSSCCAGRHAARPAPAPLFVPSSPHPGRSPAHLCRSVPHLVCTHRNLGLSPSRRILNRRDCQPRLGDRRRESRARRRTRRDGWRRPRRRIGGG
ncbi:hypothetical protein BJY59DRAFT_33960 [Rhodotorula toruloides]